MLNSIVWNGTVFVCYTESFDIELFWYLIVCTKTCTYAKVNFFKLKCLSV